VPYVGGSLTTLFDDEARQRTRLAMRQMAHRAADRMHDLIVMNTPIDSGNLRTSWYQEPLVNKVIDAQIAYEARVSTNVEYAPYVEYGTGLYGPKRRKYPILPKRAPFLAWRDPRTGQWIYARKVMHPGSPGQHMVAIAVSVLEHEVELGLFEDILARWARDIETRAETRGRVR
jgi:hypothetical protein